MPPAAGSTGSRARGAGAPGVTGDEEGGWLGRSPWLSHCAGHPRGRCGAIRSGRDRCRRGGRRSGRAQKALVEGAPEAQLGCHAALEPVEDVLAAGAFGGGVEAQQQGRPQVGQPALVAGGGGVVELIDDHHIERVRRQVRRIQPSERLHRGEHMAPLAGALAVHQQLAEGAIAQHLAKGGEALLQDLAPVGHEQQARVTRAALAGVIEGSDHGFAGAGGGHHQVAPAAMEAALGRELLDDLPSAS